MSKDQRISHFNEWPTGQNFPAELSFKKRIKEFDLKELFIPYRLPSSNDSHLHISVSYLLDMVDSLPERPDHAFDWAWRAFEYLGKTSFSTSNITEFLRKNVCPALEDYFREHPKVINEFTDLLRRIPMQTCEYLLKRIQEGGPYIFAIGKHNKLSGYAKRVLFDNGNPPVVSQATQDLLTHFHANYVYSNTQQRRDGASLLRRVLRGELVFINGNPTWLSRQEILFFAVSGLAYTFRNDRTHATSIAPFRSSTAGIKTYAHCWFMFLLTYQMTMLLLHADSSPIKLFGSLDDNFSKNNNAFSKLFGSYLHQ